MLSEIFNPYDIPYFKEGGEKAIEPEAYARLNVKAAQTGYVDFVDVEILQAMRL